MEGGGLGGQRSGIRRGVASASRLLVACRQAATWPEAMLSPPAVVPMTENPRTGRLRPLLSGVVLRSQTDARLCTLASAGNQQAFSAIFERYRHELRSHAGRLVRADRTDDVVQKAMLGAWAALLAGSQITDLRAWLHRVVHNAALDTVSKRGYDDSELPDSSIAPALTEELAEGRLNAAAALSAIAALPEGQRRALTLTAIEGHSGHDAARAMGISESAMRQLVYRARSGVRAAVTAITPMPLINLLVAGGGAPATPAEVGLGAAGVGAATAAKVIAAIGVTAATLGATHALNAPHSSHRHRPTGQAATTTADHHGLRAPGPGVQRAIVSEQLKPVRQATNRQLSGEQHAAGDEYGVSSQHNSGNGADRQSGSHGQSGSRNASGGPSDPQFGTRQNSPAPDEAATGQSAPNRSQPHRHSQVTGGISSGRSGAKPTPAPQNDQSSNVN